MSTTKLSKYRVLLVCITSQWGQLDYTPVNGMFSPTSAYNVVTYLSLPEASNNVDTVRKYMDFAVAFCMKNRNMWQQNPTVCNGMLDTVNKGYEKLQEMRNLVLQLIRTERNAHRQKRGIFNLVGQVAHSLFGMLDSDSEEFYKRKISQLEEEQLDWLKLMHEQTIVVRSTLKSVNQTLQDVSNNELTLMRELHEILNFVNMGNKKIESKYALTALSLALNDHATRI